ncbi:hypothetical protein GCM10010276_83810 [Streptomyces longisporus]|uniref:Uncharacterized protein n=2 Tax=Streptomyces longisporus TaxID=1948 RepID=A0ABP6AQ95_STRLO
MGDEAKLIDPSGIPHFIGDLATLDTDVMLLTADAGQFRASGSDVHTQFQGLSAFYSAPEAEQLFATTLPVKQKSDAFADDLEKVATALSDYSFEVQPLVQKLDALKADATAFVNSVTGDDDWRKDQDKVDHNNDLWHDVNHTVAAFQAAERTAYNKIMALIGGAGLSADDGSHGKNTYGYNADDLDHAKETPWGAPVEREYEGWSWLVHQTGQVWDGVWHDGVIGTLHGLGTLFGSDGWGAAGEAWKNLAKLGTATSLTSATLGTWWLIPDDQLPSWLRESRKVHTQAVKGFLAYDQWKTNPARAAGAFGFNVLTVAGTEGIGSAASGAGKAGAAARTLSVVGKVGRAIDPMTYIGKVGKFAFIKVGDTFTTLKNLHSGTYLDMANVADRYTPAEHPMPLAERPASVPDNAIEYVDAKGNPVYLTSNGHVLNADGSLRQHVTEAKVEASAVERQTLESTPHTLAAGTREPELVGAHAATNSVADAGHAGEPVTGSGARDVGPGSTASERPSAGESGASHGSGDASTRSHSASTGGGHGESGHRSEQPHHGQDHAHDRHDAEAEDHGVGAEEQAHHGDPAQPDFSRPELPAGTAERTLREMRNMRHSRARYKGAEDYVREMFGGGPEQHYPVAPHQHPYHPVETPGGRHVDVPVRTADGRTLAVEVKHYLEWRTVKLEGGGTKAVKGEVPLSPGIKEQINKDLTLRRKDPTFDPRWVFLHAPPSQQLRNYLVQARIIFIEFGPAPK